MTDTTPGGWPDAARPGYPKEPERDGWHWVNGTPRKWEAWDDGGAWIIGDGLFRAADFGHRIYQGPCHTPTEFAAQVEAARRDEREANIAACEGRVRWHTGDDYDSTDDDLRADGARGCIAAIRARGDAIPGRYQSEAEQERDELFNRLGRVTEELGLSMDVTASRIIEVIRERVDDEREACASVSVRVEVPPDAETWSPLEAWEEALTLFDEAFREAIRARGDA